MVRMRCYYVYREYVYSVAVYQKYLTRLGELIIFEPTDLDILIYGNIIYVFYLSFNVSSKGGQRGPIAKMGPRCPPWSQNGAILPSMEGYMAPFWLNGAISPSRRAIWPQTSRTRKEGGGESNFGLREGSMAPFCWRGGGVPNEGLLDLMSVDLVFFWIESRHFRLVSCGLRLFCLIVGKRGCGLSLFCRHFRLPAWSKEGGGGVPNEGFPHGTKKVMADFSAILSLFHRISAKRGCGLSLFCRHFRLPAWSKEGGGGVPNEGFPHGTKKVMADFSTILSLFHRISAKWGCGLSLFWIESRPFRLVMCGLSFLQAF